MQKQLLILESKYRTNTQGTNGSEYKCKLKTNTNIKVATPPPLQPPLKIFFRDQIEVADHEYGIFKFP